MDFCRIQNRPIYDFEDLRLVIARRFHTSGLYPVLILRHPNQVTRQVVPRNETVETG